MITCPYCASELSIHESGPYTEHAYCSFCQILLGPDSEHMYQKNGKRITVNRAIMITLDMAKEPISVLKQHHTLDLLGLLRISREERASQYNTLRMLNNAVKHVSEAYAETANEQGGEYELWTRLCWRIENILLERLGYFPDKVTEELVSRYEDRCNAAKKDMKISRVPRKAVPIHH